LVMEEAAVGLAGGKVGLAKFRATRAEFKSFQVAKQITPRSLPVELVNRISKSIEALTPQAAPKPDLVDAVLPAAVASVHRLRDRAKLLEQQAARLRELA